MLDHRPHQAGILASAVPGRTDKLPLSVPADSYVIPADVVSALGQGNTFAGAVLLDHYLGQPPGIAAAATHGGRQTPPPVPIVAAGGEYLIHPHHAAILGDGDIARGHRRLDAFVAEVRRRTSAKLKTMPKPR